MKITREQIKKTALEAVTGFALWTLFLTPYIYPFVCKYDIAAYENWLVMEAVMVPPIAVIVVKITNRITKRFVK